MEPLKQAAPPPPAPHRRRSLLFHQISVFLITFSAYCSFHVARKPPSIVKPVLGPNPVAGAGGWKPFDGPRGAHRLGELDLAFLASYSVGMYVAGHAGDRLDVRRLLFAGMLGSGLSSALFGLGYWWGIHGFGFFVAVQVVGGLFQSIGWPCVVAVIGKWFGKSRRGFIMGAWNSNTSVGNILGSVVASSFLEFGWGWSFLVPGIVIVVVGFFVLGFLVVDPRDVGFESPSSAVEIQLSDAAGSAPPGGVIDSAINGEDVGLLESSEGLSSEGTKAIGFLEAWRLPGVAPYAACLFFSKLVAYTFLYWLPFYIRHTAVAGEHLSEKAAGILSSVFDVGGVVGGVSAGFISDRLGARALPSVMFLAFSVPALILYRVFGGISMPLNLGLMFLSGCLVNGPYSLITTAVAADLGTQGSARGDSRALATVSAIIDGTGSVGAALGPLLTGYVSTRGWDSVFLMLIVATSLAAVVLLRLARTEIAAMRSKG